MEHDRANDNANIKCQGADCRKEGLTNLHFKYMKAWFRRQDSKIGHFIRTATEKTWHDGGDFIDDATFIHSAGGLPEGNPSRRRQGIVIGFYCEHCSYVTELTLAEHKGDVEVETR